MGFWEFIVQVIINHGPRMKMVAQEVPLGDSLYAALIPQVRGGTFRGQIIILEFCLGMISRRPSTGLFSKD